uniref:VWFA domain-containing protein n=1 Tax=Romanomermis culicivorax TaxID=13658 RepID=A0A915KBV3_ROMCU
MVFLFIARETALTSASIFMGGKTAAGIGVLISTVESSSVLQDQLSIDVRFLNSNLEKSREKPTTSNGACYCTCNAQDSRERALNILNIYGSAYGNQAQTIRLICYTECRIDLVLVIDSSGSVQRVFHTYKQAALQFTKDLTFGLEAAHAAIVQYSFLPPALKYSFKDEQNNALVDKALQQLEFLGDSTYTAEAVNMG